MVVVHRRNLLDRMICGVRDCANKLDGFYPVDAVTGRKTGVCFNRRKDPRIKTKAHLRSDLVVEDLKRILKLYQDVADHVEYFVHNESQPFVKELAKTKNASDYIASEDLFKFETDFEEKSMATSVKTWLKLLQGWGLTGDQEITRKVLVDSGFRGTRPDEPTAARLSNADEIFKVLKNTQFSHYFRQ